MELAVNWINRELSKFPFILKLIYNIYIYILQYDSRVENRMKDATHGYIDTVQLRYRNTIIFRDIKYKYVRVEERINCSKSNKVKE